MSTPIQFQRLPQAEALPSLVLALLDRAEFEASAPQGSRSGEAAGGDQIVRTRVEMELELVGELLFEGAAIDEQPPPPPQRSGEHDSALLRLERQVQGSR